MQLLVQRVVGDGVDGEVATAEVFAQVADELDAVGTPAVREADLAAKGGDLDRERAVAGLRHHHGDGAVGNAGGDGVLDAEDGDDLFGLGRGGEVKVLAAAALGKTQQVADSAADQVGLMPSLF